MYAQSAWEIMLWTAERVKKRGERTGWVTMVRMMELVLVLKTKAGKRKVKMGERRAWTVA